MELIKEFEDCSFVLLTRGRTEEQTTLQQFPPFIRSLVDICCHPGEASIIQNKWGEQVHSVREYEGSYVGEVRDWIVNNFSSKYIFFIEDNIDFHVREYGPDLKKSNVNGLCGLFPMNPGTHSDTLREEVFINMFLDIYEKLQTNEYGMVGISQRSGNQYCLESFIENKRLFGFWALNREKYLSLPEKFSDVQYREDFYIELSFLLNAIKIGVFYKYAFNKKRGVNSPGGCSSYRTQAGTNANAVWMSQVFDGLVSVSKKQKKTWQGYEDIFDVIVQWKKAYKLGLEIKNQENGN